MTTMMFILAAMLPPLLIATMGNIPTPAGKKPASITEELQLLRRLIEGLLALTAKALRGLGAGARRSRPYLAALGQGLLDGLYAGGRATLALGGGAKRMSCKGYAALTTLLAARAAARAALEAAKQAELLNAPPATPAPAAQKPAKQQAPAPAPSQKPADDKKQQASQGEKGADKKAPAPPPQRAAALEETDTCLAKLGMLGDNTRGLALALKTARKAMRLNAADPRIEALSQRIEDAREYAKLLGQQIGTYKATLRGDRLSRKNTEEEISAAENRARLILIGEISKLNDELGTLFKDIGNIA